MRFLPNLILKKHVFEHEWGGGQEMLAASLFIGYKYIDPGLREGGRLAGFRRGGCGILPVRFLPNLILKKHVFEHELGGGVKRC